MLLSIVIGWDGNQNFGFPTQMTMDAIGIKKHQTYIRYFNDLVDWGFFLLIQKSKNQYSANIISINSAVPKNGKALDKAIIKHRAKQIASIGQSNSSIDKQVNKEPINQEQEIIDFGANTKFEVKPRSLKIPFDLFWDLYDKKTSREKCQKKWLSLSKIEMELAIEYIPKYKLSQPDKKFRKNPETFLNNKSWNDELIGNSINDKGFPDGYILKQDGYNREL